MKDNKRYINTSFWLIVCYSYRAPFVFWIFFISFLPIWLVVSRMYHMHLFVFIYSLVLFVFPFYLYFRNREQKYFTTSKSSYIFLHGLSTYIWKKTISWDDVCWIRHGSKRCMSGWCTVCLNFKWWPYENKLPSKMIPSGLVGIEIVFNFFWGGYRIPVWFCFSTIILNRRFCTNIHKEKS